MFEPFTERSGQALKRFTERSLQVLELSHQQAGRLGHNVVGTEHLLLGLIQEGQGVAAHTLQLRGIDLETVLMKVMERIGLGSRPTVSPSFSSEATQVLAEALRDALQLGHPLIGTEHILLSLGRETDGGAAQILVSLGVDLARLREDTIELISSPPSNKDATVEDVLVSPLFSDESKRTLVLAADASRLLGHDYVGTEHILFGLVNLRSGLAAKTLDSLGVNPEALNQRMASTTAADAQFSGDQPLSPETEKLIIYAAREQVQLGSDLIGTEHLLMGLVQEAGVGAQILSGLGLNLSDVRPRLIEFMLNSKLESLPQKDLHPHSDASLTPTSHPLPIGVADELTKLVTLRNQGVLSEAEFDLQKAKLLGTS